MKILKIINNIPAPWRFLFVVILLYLIILIFNYELFASSIIYCGTILGGVLQAFIIVFVLMVASDYFITPQFITKYLDKNILVKWSMVVMGGIISSGPIYMWYPLLGDLRGKVLNDGMVACFLYNRAIKIPLLPVALLYFSWLYLLILGLTMIIASIFQGVLINYLQRSKDENCYS
jgi:hypothetical protein